MKQEEIPVSESYTILDGKKKVVKKKVIDALLLLKSDIEFLISEYEKEEGD